MRGHINVGGRESRTNPGRSVKIENVLAASAGECHVESPGVRVFHRQRGKEVHSRCCIGYGWKSLLCPCSAGKLEMPDLSQTASHCWHLTGCCINSRAGRNRDCSHWHPGGLCLAGHHGRIRIVQYVRAGIIRERLPGVAPIGAKPQAIGPESDHCLRARCQRLQWTVKSASEILHAASGHRQARRRPGIAII